MKTVYYVLLSSISTSVQKNVLAQTLQGALATGLEAFPGYSIRSSASIGTVTIDARVTGSPVVFYRVQIKPAEGQSIGTFVLAPSTDVAISASLTEGVAGAVAEGIIYLGDVDLFSSN